MGSRSLSLAPWTVSMTVGGEIRALFLGGRRSHTLYDLDQEGKRGPNPALWWVSNEGDEVKWSFREVTDLTCRTANVLTQTCGLQQGDRLALILPRVPEWWLVALGCIRAGQ